MKFLIGYIPSETDAKRDILPYVLASHEIDGVEVNFSEIEAGHWLDYNVHMARTLTEAGKIYQVHLPEITPESLTVLDNLEPLIQAVGGQLNAVVHHALGKSVEEDIEKTFWMIDMIYSRLKQKGLNVVIHLENLNVINSLDIFPEETHDKWKHIVGRERININRIDRFLEKYPELKLCLDIGHVISDKLSFELSSLQKERVGNIHIHDADHHCDHKRNGTCTDIRLVDAFVKSVFNLKSFCGHGVIEIAKSNLGFCTEETITILEKEIQLMKGQHYSEIIFTDGTQMPRDKAFGTCSVCAAEAGEHHQSYCEKEVCPLCGKYLNECSHMEGYSIDSDTSAGNQSMEMSA